MLSKQFMLNVAEVSDAFRVVPRMLLIAVGLYVWWISDWYMHLETRGTTETVITGIVSLIVPAVINLYQTSGRKWDKD